MNTRGITLGSSLLMSVCAVTLVAVASLAAAQQSKVITKVMSGGDQIEQLKTAPGITTRVSFPESVEEIICGDLYDPANGTGSFVVQRSDNDVFLKPIVPKGISNLFVKTGEKRERTYSFDLVIVPAREAYRIVKIINEPPKPTAAKEEVKQNQTPLK